MTYEAHLRLFNARRLHPWLSEHDVFIRGELAKLEVTDPSAAQSHREFYEKKLQEYVNQQKQEEVKVEEALNDGEITKEDLELIIAKKEKEKVKEEVKEELTIADLEKVIEKKEKKVKKHKIS